MHLAASGSCQAKLTFRKCARHAGAAKPAGYFLGARRLEGLTPRFTPRPGGRPTQPTFAPGPCRRETSGRRGPGAGAVSPASARPKLGGASPTTRCAPTLRRRHTEARPRAGHRLGLSRDRSPRPRTGTPRDRRKAKTFANLCYSGDDAMDRHPVGHAGPRGRPRQRDSLLRARAECDVRHGRQGDASRRDCVALLRPWPPPTSVRTPPGALHGGLCEARRGRHGGRARMADGDVSGGTASAHPSRVSPGPRRGPPRTTSEKARLIARV